MAVWGEELGIERRERRKRGLQIRNEAHGRLLLLLADGAAALLAVGPRDAESIGHAGEALADIGVAEGATLERARRRPDRGRKPAKPRERVLEESHQRGC